MPLLQIALRRDGLCDIERPEAGAGGVEAAVRAAAAGLPEGAPVVIMLHGRGYRPGAPRDCPHRLLYADRDSDGRSRCVSWTRRLGLGGPAGPRHPGLAVGVGWDSAGSIWSAARAADGAAPGLARLVTLIRRALPDRPVDLLAHSLGARVALGALPLLHPGAVGRAILMAGADFVGRAEAALASPAGRAAEVVNVISRENDLYDWMFETALGGGRALGAGLGHLPNAVDVQIDGRAARRGLARLGFRLAEPRLRVCHWSVYLRPGVFPFYRALIHRRAALPLERLRAALAARPDPRWVRLAEGPLPLPFAGRGHTLPL